MKFLTLILTFTTLMSCGNTKHASALNNEKQSMNTISGDYQIEALGTKDVSEYNLTISFNDSTKTVSGFAGCNRFSGTYILTENNLSFGPIVSTKMACIDSVNEIETMMLKALSKTNNYSLNKQKITILNGDDNLIKATQENSYSVEYTAMSRGLFNKYVFKNGKLSIQKDRTSAPIVKTFTENETNAILEKIKALDLEKLKTLEAPTEKRFFDGAAIANLEITYLEKTYQTPEFDHGEPNKDIAPLVNYLLSLSETKQKID